MTVTQPSLKPVQLQYRAAKSLCRRLPLDQRRVSRRVNRAPIIRNAREPDPAVPVAPGFAKYDVLDQVVRPVVSPPAQDHAAKSYAQVETLVRPQVVRPMSRGGLKPKRTKPFRLMGRFSDEEKDIVVLKAKAAKLSLNQYVRATVLGSDYVTPHDPELLNQLLATNRELTAQGNNLNQIARHLNGHAVTPEQGDSMLAMLGRSMLKTHHMIRRVLAGNRPGPTS